MLVCIGDLIADIVVIGVGSLDRGTDNPVTITQTRGGSAANVAVAAALDGPVRFIGSIGTDATGTALVQQLQHSGVEVRVQRHGRTGSIVVLVDNTGERTMLTDRGASAHLAAIDPCWLADATWIHVPLYGFAEAESRGSILEACRRANVPTSLDLSSVASMREFGFAGLQAIVDTLSPAVVFANEDEAVLADAFGIRMPSNAVYLVKRGPLPVIIRLKDQEHEVPVPEATVVDTTGAGDAFAAGFLQQMLSSDSVEASVLTGINRAQQALGQPGALS